MKKRVLFIVLIALCAFPLSAKPIDVVVMLDTSESVLPIYEDLVNFIVKNVLTNHVRYGDTFHLISFDSKPDLIFSKQLQDSDDLEEVVAGLLLLNPLGKHTDLVMALKYLNQHVSSLSNGSSSEIVILTDGIHDPPPGSPFQQIIKYDEKSGEKINLLENEIKEISKYSWKVSIVKLPENISDVSKIPSSNLTGNGADTGSGNAVNTGPGGTSEGGEEAKSDNTASERVFLTSPSEENNIFTFTRNGKSRIFHTEFTGDPDSSETVATGSPRIYYPENTGIIKYHFSLPVEIENFYSSPILLKLDNVQFDGKNILKEKMNIKILENKKKKVSIPLLLPYTLNPGKQKIEFKLDFSDSNRAFPENAVVSVILKKSFTDSIKDINIVFKTLFFILIIAVLAGFFFIFFSSFVHVSVRDSYKVIKKDFEVMVSDKSLRPLAFKVSGQNDIRIGSRNIHNFNDKSVKTIGGGNSSYLIFLYKVPARIAEIYHSEGRYYINVIRAEFFPEINKDTVEVILNERIKLKTENNIILDCYFYEYVSPLEQINTIMKLTDHRGMTEKRIII